MNPFFSPWASNETSKPLPAFASRSFKTPLTFSGTWTIVTGHRVRSLLWNSKGQLLESFFLKKFPQNSNKPFVPREHLSWLSQFFQDGLLNFRKNLGATLPLLLLFSSGFPPQNDTKDRAGSRTFGQFPSLPQKTARTPSSAETFPPIESALFLRPS